MHRQRESFSIGHLKDKSSGGKSSAQWQTHLTLAKPTGEAAREAKVTEHENTHNLSHLKVILHIIRYHFSHSAHMHLSNGVVQKRDLYVHLTCKQLTDGGGKKERILSNIKHANLGPHSTATLQIQLRMKRGSSPSSYTRDPGR